MGRAGSSLPADGVWPLLWFEPLGKSKTHLSESWHDKLTLMLLFPSENLLLRRAVDQASRLRIEAGDIFKLQVSSRNVIG